MYARLEIDVVATFICIILFVPFHAEYQDDTCTYEILFHWTFKR